MTGQDILYDLRREIAIELMSFFYLQSRAEIRESYGKTIGDMPQRFKRCSSVHLAVLSVAHRNSSEQRVPPEYGQQEIKVSDS
jgi:hypothetical protein